MLYPKKIIVQIWFILNCGCLGGTYLTPLSKEQKEKKKTRFYSITVPVFDLINYYQLRELAIGNAFDDLG